jgi:hypothetical protein
MTSDTTPTEDFAVEAVAKRALRPAVKKVTQPVTQKTAVTAARRPVGAAPKTAGSKATVVTGAAPDPVPSGTRLKPRKSKTIHKNFTLPMLEYLMLETLKLRSSKLGSPVKKNVLVRAGIKALAAMSDARFLAELNTVSSSKNTRASKD